MQKVFLKLFKNIKFYNEMNKNNKPICSKDIASSNSRVNLSSSPQESIYY